MERHYEPVGFSCVQIYRSRRSVIHGVSVCIQGHDLDLPPAGLVVPHYGLEMAYGIGDVVLNPLECYGCPVLLFAYDDRRQVSVLYEARRRLVYERLNLSWRPDLKEFLLHRRKYLHVDFGLSVRHGGRLLAA